MSTKSKARRKIRMSTKSKEYSPNYPSVKAFAAEMGIGYQAAYAGLRNGTIPSIRLGKRFIIPRAAIDEWLRKAGKAPAA